MDNIVENSLLEKEKGTPGRKKGTTYNKTYKWKVVIFNKETHSFKEGKYFSVNHINQELSQELNLNKPLNSDYVRRIMTKYRADKSMKYGEKSFLARYGHIHIEKINEPVKS